MADTEDPPLCPLMASAFGIIIIIIRIIRIFCLLSIYNVRLYKYLEILLHPYMNLSRQIL